VGNGAPWRDVPERYGPLQTLTDRLYRWRCDGTWDCILAYAQIRSDAVGEVVCEVSIAAAPPAPISMLAAHGVGPTGPTQEGVQHPADEGLERSLGRLTTKFHLACDGKGRPLSSVITPGHRHDSTQLEPLLDGIRVRRPGRRGRPRTRPTRRIADKGYSYPRCRRRQRQVAHTIPQRSDQRARRAARRGRPLAFDRATYARRNVVERGINRLKQWRGVATRYEKRAIKYRAMAVLAAIVIWLDT
jgi:transposase